MRRVAVLVCLAACASAGDPEPAIDATGGMTIDAPEGDPADADPAAPDADPAAPDARVSMPDATVAPPPPDAAVTPPPPDATVMPPADAGVVCTTDSMCGPGQCCFTFGGPMGFCVAGMVIPGLGCVPDG